MADPALIHRRKQALRRGIAAALAELSSADRGEADAALCQQFRAWLALHTERPAAEAWAGLRLLAYMPMVDEPDLTPLLHDCLAGGGELVLPRVEKDLSLSLHRIGNLAADLRVGAYGIHEPHPDLPTTDPTAIDVLLLPGRAFTADGDRLGRGKGFYDRLLTRTHALCVALAYDCQIVKTLPTTKTDLPAHIILTPTRTLDCRGRVDRTD